MTEEEMERAAAQIADEAVEGYEQSLPAHVIAEMRRVIIFDLLASDLGRARLLRAFSAGGAAGGKPATSSADAATKGRKE